MENNEVRFYDIRSSKGRLPFLKKVGLCDIFPISMMFPVQILPDVAEPPMYWLETDPRAEAGHFGIICQMVIDFQPFSFVNNKGFLLDKRKTMPMFQVHTPWWYQDKIEKVTFILNRACQLSFFIFSSVLIMQGKRWMKNCAVMTLQLCGSRWMGGRQRPPMLGTLYL